MQSHTRVHIHHDDSVLDAILSSKTGQARPLLSCYHSYSTANGEFGGELRCYHGLGTANGEHWRTTPSQRVISAAKLIQ